jgi:hypothetical protein
MTVFDFFAFGAIILGIVVGLAHALSKCIDCLSDKD